MVFSNEIKLTWIEEMYISDIFDVVHGIIHSSSLYVCKNEALELDIQISRIGFKIISGCANTDDFVKLHFYFKQALLFLD